MGHREEAPKGGFGSLPKLEGVQAVVTVLLSFVALAGSARIDGALFDVTEGRHPRGLLGLPLWSEAVAMGVIGAGALVPLLWRQVRGGIFAIPLILIVAISIPATWTTVNRTEGYSAVPSFQRGPKAGAAQPFPSAAEQTVLTMRRATT